MKDWVRLKLLEGSHTKQILTEHMKNIANRENAGDIDRDCNLKSQDIRNIAAKLAELTWKLHPNEAQSVHLFKQQHPDLFFTYLE